MSPALDAASWLCLLGGASLCVIGGVGLLRLPDLYSRTHAAGITDTLGAGLILLGLIFQAGFDLVTVKLATIVVFLSITSPTSAHALVKAAYARGVKAVVRDDAGRDALR